MTNAPDHDLMLEAIDQPVLLLQEHPRQVVAGNLRALELFGKTRVAGLRGGEVFDCLHSFSDGGCGRNAHCEPCTIKSAIVDTLTTCRPHHDVSATLQVKKADGIRPYALQLSTEKTGDMALVRIERYSPED